MTQTELANDLPVPPSSGDDSDAAIEREARLVALVDRWTAHMRWRKNYDRWREDRVWQEETQMPRLRAIEREIGPVSGKRALDIGSGMGGFLVAAASQGMLTTGVEPNGDYCTITRLRAARYGCVPAVLRGVGEELPFHDATFDVVLALDILEHVRDPDATLREIRRVLKPDGVAFVTVINRFAWRDPHYHLRGVNWLPRAWGEWAVERIGRSKRGAGFADNQRLAEMYYDTLAGFVSRASRLGFGTYDTREAALVDRSSGTGGRRAAIVAWLARWRLLLPVYRAHRFLVASTFEVALRPGMASR